MSMIGLRHVGRDREADALVAAGARQDRGVDADQVAVHVDQRAARVAGVDRRVGLDEVLVVLDADRGPADRRDDAHGHRLADAERVADRQHDLAEPQLRRVADRDGLERRQLAALGRHQLQHRDVAARIAADQPGVELDAVAQRDLDRRGVVDDVGVGQDAPVAGHDHAGAQALGLAGIAVAEERRAGIVPERIRREGPGRVVAWVVEMLTTLSTTRSAASEMSVEPGANGVAWATRGSAVRATTPTPAASPSAHAPSTIVR
jgi:hypothetical protein